MNSLAEFSDLALRAAHVYRSDISLHQPYLSNVVIDRFRIVRLEFRPAKDTYRVSHDNGYF